MRRGLWCLLLLLPPLALASGADDCGTGADAGDTAWSATPLPLPVAACGGELPVGDGHDVFSFQGHAGQTLRSLLHHPGEIGEAELCLLRPGDQAWTVCGTQFGDDEIAFELDVDGEWTLVVMQGFGERTVYELSASVEQQVVTGTILAGHPLAPRGVPSLTRETGIDGLDGRWVELATPATGDQRADLRATDNAFVDLDLWFHDQHGLTEEQPCAVAGTGRDERCVVPVGATRAFATARSGVAVPIEVVYWH